VYFVRRIQSLRVFLSMLEHGSFSAAGWESGTADRIRAGPDPTPGDPLGSPVLVAYDRYAPEEQALRECEGMISSGLS
jgi:hypothetical protein